MVKEGSSDYKKLKKWFYKEPLTECFFVEPNVREKRKKKNNHFMFKPIQKPYKTAGNATIQYNRPT